MIQSLHLLLFIAMENNYGNAWFWFWLIIIFFAIRGCAENSNKKKFIYEPYQIETYIPVRDSMFGICDCPYDIALDRDPCGNTSAYSRTGGAEPQCYLYKKVYRKVYIN